MNQRKGESPKMISQSFILPTYVNAMSFTKTLQGITWKDLIMVLDSNQVVWLPKTALNPRRPLPKEIKDSINLKNEPLPFE